MIVGTQLAFAVRVLREVTAPTAGKRTAKDRRELVTLVMQVVVTIAVFGGAAFLLRRPGTPDQEKAVWAAVGIVIGYWLR